MVAAAGNDAERAYAAPRDSLGDDGRGARRHRRRRQRPPRRRARLTGAMTVRREVAHRSCSPATSPAPGSTRDEATRCVPGSLDAARTADAVVLCERGRGRPAREVDRGRARRRGRHGPGQRRARQRRPRPPRRADRPPRTRRPATGWSAGYADRTPARRPRPDRRRVGPVRVAAWSAGGDPLGSFVKPDLVVPATGVLAATPPGPIGDGRWAMLNGTSAAAARTSGAAATLLARHDWSAAVVRSVLATRHRPVPGGTLRTGSGRPRLDVAMRTRLASSPTRPTTVAGRAARASTSTPRRCCSAATAPGPRARSPTSGAGRATGRSRPTASTATTSRSRRSRCGSTRASRRRSRYGCRGRPAGGLDDGTITWRGPDDVRVRIPVVIGR